MNRQLLFVALLAVSGAASAQLKEMPESEALKASTEESTLCLTIDEDKNDLQVSTPTSIKKTPATGVWYARPKGTFVKSFTKYNEASGGSNTGGFSTYNAPLLSVPVATETVFPNMCTNKEEATWGFNSKYFDDKESGLFNADNDGVRSTSNRNGTYYIPQLKVGENLFFWGEEAYTSNSLTTDTICALSYEEKGKNNSMYTGFSGNIYCFGTASTEFDFDDDGVKETVYQDAIECSYPKPIVPLSFDYAFAPTLSYNSDSVMFKNGAKIKLTIYNDDTNEVVWEAEAGDGDYTNGTSASGSMTIYGNLMFRKVEKDVFDNDYNVPCTLDFPYTVRISGFQNEGVDLGIRMIKRTTYEKLDAPKVYRYYVDKEGKAVGSLSWTSNTYGIPLAFHGMYEVMNISVEYDTSSGNHMTDMNVIKIDNAGTSAIAGSSTSLSVAQIYTQIAWYDSEMNENYSAELPEWITSMTYTPSSTAKSSYGTIEFQAEELPSSLEGRGDMIYIKSVLGGVAKTPIYLLQGNYTKEMVNKDHGIITYQKGDVNKDESITVADLSLLAAYILGRTSDIDTTLGDLNGDGSISVADVATLAATILQGEAQ